MVSAKIGENCILRSLIYTMMKYKSLLAVVLVFVTVLSCKKDDEGGIDVIPARDLAEVAAEDNDSIVEYLKTHFYNYEEFTSPPAEFDFKIKIDTLAGTNADKTSLFDMVTTKTVVLKDEEGVDVPHILYYLIAREGINESPSVAAETFVSYKGELMYGDVFDQRDIPLWFQLLGVVRGWGEFIPELKKGGDAIDNGDGTFSFEDYGVGLVIMPSGLGYFNNAQTNIPAYSPLIFSVNLFDINEDVDNDEDGILSKDEDPDGDGNPRNDDTDDDNIPNYLDADDDGDGVLTINEYDEDNNGMPDDTDGDGIPDYLDNKNE